MPGRILMVASAALLGCIGLAAVCIPRAVLGLHGTVPDNATVLFVQMAGAVYLGFATLNLAARGILVGNRYARPVAAGNFLHFAIVAIILTRAATTFGAVQLMLSAAVFSLFAICFGLVVLRPPA